MPKNIEKTTFAENKKARFDYEIIEEHEAGIILYGEEVKSVRNGNIQLKGSYIILHKGLPRAVGIHIGELKGATRKLDPKRERGVLLSQKEILRLEQKTKEMGATLVPLSLYSKGNLIKVRIALVRGKKTWQKKEALKARDLDRELAGRFRP